MRLQNMMGQPEMFDHAFLAAHAAAGLNGGTPGARQPMFTFPPMFPAAYRTSR